MGLMDINKRFKENILTNKLIQKDDKVLLLNSFGKDATVLMDLLYRLQKEISFELIVVLFQVPIHTYGNQKEWNHILDYWSERGITIDIIKFEPLELWWEECSDVKEDIPCQECRKLRNKQIITAIEKYQPNKVAAGFNLTDLQSYTTMMQLLSDYTFDVNQIKNKRTADRFISLIPRHFMKVQSTSNVDLEWVLPILIFDDACICKYLEERKLPYIHEKCKFKSQVSRSIFKQFIEKLQYTYEFESSYTNLMNFLMNTCRQNLDAYVNDNWKNS